MTKFIIRIITLITVFNFVSLVKAQELPLIHQTFIRGDFDATNGGYISTINPLDLKETSRIDLPTSSSQTIKIDANKTFAFINNSPFVDAKKGLTIVNLLEQSVVKRMFDDMGVYAVAIDPKGRIWALVEELEKIAVIDPNTLQVIKMIDLGEAGRDIVFSPNGNLGYVSLLTKDIKIIDINSLTSSGGITNLPIRNRNQIRPQEMAISLDGNRIYISGENNISIVDINTKLVIETIPLPIRSTSLLLRLSPDGRFLYAGEYLGTVIAKYNISNGVVSKPFTVQNQKGIISNLSISSNGDVLYINRFYGISLFDTKEEAFITDIETSTGVGFPNPFSLGLTLTGDFSVGQAPSLTTVSPTSGDNILANQQVQITWTTTVAPQSYALASHKVELSTDNGQSFTVIPGAEELPGEARSFTWNVPNIESLTARIKVSTVDLGARRTSSTTGTFGILRSLPGDIDAPTVNFTSPNGGETFSSGSNLAINWVSSDNVGVTGQDLSLSIDGGQTFPITLASGLAASTQSFNFPIPQSLSTTQARLRLVVRDMAGNVGQAVTASNFTIAQAVDNIAPTITISQPTTNSNLVAGGPIQVNWASTDNRAVVSQALFLSLNGGQSFTQVASFGANDSSFVINNVAGLNLDFTTPQAIVRITATDQAGNTGMNNSTFIISPMLSMSNYQAKLLTVNGIGFTSNGDNNNVQIFINGKLINVAPKTLTNTTLTLKGNKKKLNLSKGGNSVMVVVDGVMSNESSFQF
ncbi:MAG: hypothetical protein WAQ98_16135 [Blastocatellia bacterium]